MVVVLAVRQEEREGMTPPAGVCKEQERVEEMARGCKNRVNQEKNRGSADQQGCKELDHNHSRLMAGMAEYSRVVQQPWDQWLVMLPIEDEGDRIQRSDQLLQNREYKQGRVFRIGDKPSLPEEAHFHKNGSSSRVLLRLKSN